MPQNIGCHLFTSRMSMAYNFPVYSFFPYCRQRREPFVKGFLKVVLLLPRLQRDERWGKIWQMARSDISF